MFKAAAVVSDTKRVLKNLDAQGLAELRALQKPDNEIEDLLAAIIIIGMYIEDSISRKRELWLWVSMGHSVMKTWRLGHSGSNQNKRELLFTQLKTVLFFFCSKVAFVRFDMEQGSETSDGEFGQVS